MRHICVLVIVLFVCLVPTIAQQVVYDIPYLKGITLDGNTADWETRGLLVEMPMDRDGNLVDPQNCRPQLRIGWDGDGLLLLVEVQDDVFAETEKAESLWEGDSLEIFMGNGYGKTEHFQLAISPGIDGTQQEVRRQFLDRRSDLLRVTPLQATIARKVVQGGYGLEVLLAWANLGITPKIGAEVSLQVNVNDSDAPGGRIQFRWFPQDGAWGGTKLMHALRLAEQPSAPVLAAAQGVTERLRRYVITVAGTPELVGKRVAIKEGEKVWVEGTLAADAYGFARAELLMPETTLLYANITAVVEGQAPLLVMMPNLLKERQAALQRAEFQLKPYVFSGATFPKGDFAQPTLMEDLMGRYTVKTTYFNAAGDEVAYAATPGRYGARVGITAPRMKTVRYFTLYRLPEKVDWNKLTLPRGLEFPAWLGVEAMVQGEQHEVMADFSKWMLKETLAVSEDSAILLSWLAEKAPNCDGPATARNDAWTRNANWLNEVKLKRGELPQYPYIAQTPDGYDANPTRRWPMVIYLHGSGERSDNTEILAKHFTSHKFMEFTKTQYPGVVIAPVCPQGEWWSAFRLNRLLDEMKAKYRIDASRIYLTGYSMGGYGTFTWAIDSPQHFAAIAPLCGGGDDRDAFRLKGIPTWVFHGAKDSTVPIIQSERMVDALKKAGGNVAFTNYPDLYHDVWTETYNNPALYLWMFLQQK